MSARVLLLAAAVAALQPASAVLPVYRDLLRTPPPAREAECGWGTGPFTVLGADTPKETAAALVRDLDAAGVLPAAERALARVRAALPGPHVTICLYPGELTGGLPYLGGVGGVSLGGGHIKLFLHPQPKGLDRVPYTVAHEYFHEAELAARRGAGPIDIVVREGKADNFAVSLYPALRPRHTQPLSDAELAAAWRELLEDTRPPSPTFRTDFMIGRNPKVTAWPGYRLGYEMVELYLRAHPGPPARWVGTPAQEIFDYYRQHGRPARK